MSGVGDASAVLPRKRLEKNDRDDASGRVCFQRRPRVFRFYRDTGNSGYCRIILYYRIDTDGRIVRAENGLRRTRRRVSPSPLNTSLMGKKKKKKQSQRRKRVACTV